MSLNASKVGVVLGALFVIVLSLQLAHAQSPSRATLYMNYDQGLPSWDSDAPGAAEKDGDIAQPQFRGQAKSLAVRGNVYAVFYSEADRTGSKLCVKGPHDIKDLRTIDKINKIEADVNGVITIDFGIDGNWNEEIHGVQFFSNPPGAECKEGEATRVNW